MSVWSKTCFMIDTLERGGAQTQLLLMAKHLKENKIPSYNLIVFREPFTLLDAFKEAGVNVLIIRKQKVIDVFFIFNLIKCLRKLQPKIVVTFLITADMWGRLAALVARVPVVGNSVRSLPQDWGFYVNTFLATMDRFSDFIVCNSKMAADVTRQKSKLPAENVRVIYNGIEFGAEERIPPDATEITIGIVARLVPLKDVSTLLRAFTKLSSKFSTRVLIVGDGPSRPSLEVEAAQLGIAESVLFLGERSDVQEIIPQFHIAILTSKYEGLSNAIMEYMRAGKPVVATDVGGNTELVEDGVTGYLFEPGNDTQLSEIINKLLSSPNNRALMGRCGRHKMIDSFSVETMVTAWDATLTICISKNIAKNSANAKEH